MNRLLKPSALLTAAFLVAATATTSAQLAKRFTQPERAELASLRAEADDQLLEVTVELHPPTVDVAPEASNREILAAHRNARLEQQDAFINSLPAYGVTLLPVEIDAPQPNGMTQRIRHRYTTVLNGFSAHVVARDIGRLKTHPDVLHVSRVRSVGVQLNKGVDYALGSAFEPMDRRLAVYGATEELVPAGDGGSHPETPVAAAVDGVEGQGMVAAVIDTGVDWKHPMYGGTGQTTPNPQFPPAQPSANDNKKVTYLVNFTAGAPGDDFGHGTFVGTNLTGFRVDGLTPPNLGYGTGPNGQGIGPTPGGVVLHGIAPQATVMAYKTLSGAGTGLNASSQLALDDTVSDCVTAVDTSGECVDKPIADVVNLSLGGGGSATSSKTANNAALAGAVIVASAGNDGPDPTTVGAPCMGTMVICIGASLDPGSLASGAVLAPGEITGETGAGVGPPAEFGADSEANASQPGEEQAMRIFVAAGGGPVEGGTVSAHYVYADMADNSGPPLALQNRIALVQGTGAFANIANYAATMQPVAILIISDVESATAVTVVGGVPTYTLPVATAEYLRNLNASEMAHGDISEHPLRVSESVAIDDFAPGMAGFSSRGPNAVPGSDYRNIKPDVTAPGSGILAGGTPDGNPDGALGMANPNGYLVASGTSFSGPITAGATTLIRQRVRDLGFDTTDIEGDPDYRTKRFDAATITRALLQNTATNLRTGRGVPEVHGEDSTTIHDLGSGHIDIAAALDADAIMTAPTRLLGDGVEFDMPALNPPELEENGDLTVWLPTHAFGRVGVAFAPFVVSKTTPVRIRDITGNGGGTYNLVIHDDISLDHPAVSVEFFDVDGETPISTVDVPTDGEVEFLVRVSVDGTQYDTPDTDIAWYVQAVHSGSGKSLQVPFYLRAVTYVSPVVAAAPEQGQPTDVDTAAEAPDCSIDTDSAYTLNFSYTIPDGGVAPIGFRIQEGSSASALFEDTADEPLVGGANSLWAGSPQWSSSSNPSGSAAYYVPDNVDQNEALTMVTPVTLPSSATLSFDSAGQTEADFDYVHVEVVVDGGTIALGTFTGDLSGTKTFDLSPFGGKDVQVQFRMQSDPLLGDVGWWVDNIRIEADDFAAIGETDASATSFAVASRATGTYFYRVAGLFDESGLTVAGPYSNIECVEVETDNVPPIADAGADFTASPGKTAKLVSGNSVDPDGEIAGFSWSQVSGDAVELQNADRSTAKFKVPELTEGTQLVFQLEVTDDGGKTATDQVTVTVGAAIVANEPITNNRLGGALSPLWLLGIVALLAVRRRTAGP